MAPRAMLSECSPRPCCPGGQVDAVGLPGGHQPHQLASRGNLVAGAYCSAAGRQAGLGLVTPGFVGN